MYRILTPWKEDKELNVITAFMKWQRINFSVEFDICEALKKSHGKLSIMIFIDEILIANGFFKFLEYFEKNESRLI